MLNILPNIWINPDQIESLHYQKSKVNGDSLMICMASGASFTVIQKMNEIMKEIEEYFLDEAPAALSTSSKPAAKRKYTKKEKIEEKPDAV